MPNINDWFSSLDIENGEEPESVDNAPEGSNYTYKDTDIVDFYKKVNDENKTPEENIRDGHISNLLESYVNAYKSKITTQKCFRCILFLISMLIIVAFASVFVSLLVNFDFSSDLDTSESLIGLISVCVTFLTSVIGILKIIVKYRFPENDEKYITEIVKAVQQNDLENKKENLKHKLAMKNDTKKL